MYQILYNKSNKDNKSKNGNFNNQKKIKSHKLIFDKLRKLLEI